MSLQQNTGKEQARPDDDNDEPMCNYTKDKTLVKLLNGRLCMRTKSDSYT